MSVPPAESRKIVKEFILQSGQPIPLQDLKDLSLARDLCFGTGADVVSYILTLRFTL